MSVPGGDTAIVHALAGSGAAAISLLMFYPLDVVRTHMQLARKDEVRTRRMAAAATAYVEEYGWAALYQGVLPSIQTQWISFFVYFLVYQQLKVLVASRGSGVETTIGPVINLGVAAVAGAVNVVVTAPLWLAATRLKMWRSTTGPTGQQHQRPPSLWELIISIGRTEGVPSLWAGVGSSLVLVANPMIQFAVYEQSKRLATLLSGKASGAELSGAIYFLLGGWAKVVATLSTYPLQVVQSRQRALKKSDAARQSPPGVVTALLELARENGLVGLYAGVDAKLVQTTLTNAFMFLTYEKLVKLTTTALHSL
jgi:adenine nucleotide transporter 17|eukprot:m.147802 g.147802  ORF g.147802 m.147802 type:complete len:311 (+) comp23169_c0_seq1:360-1292(+)